MTDARQRPIDGAVIWRLDRFGRSLRHFITAIEEFQAAGVAFVPRASIAPLAAPHGFYWPS